MTAPRRILVAGATGVIGRSLVPMLLAHGDEVVGLARSEASAERVRALGATAVRGDALDRERVHAAVAEVRPDVIVHQLTAIPRGARNPRRMGEALAPTNRLRREATRHLVEAGESHRVRRIVAQSVAFAYRPQGPWVVDETAPLDTEAKGAWGEIVGAIVALEEAVTTASGVTGVVLRFGGLYGPGTATAADGLAGRLARARRLPVVGSGEGRQSFLHPHDAATAPSPPSSAARGSTTSSMTTPRPRTSGSRPSPPHSVPRRHGACPRGSCAWSGGPTPSAP